MCTFSSITKKESDEQKKSLHYDAFGFCLGLGFDKLNIQSSGCDIATILCTRPNVFK